MKQNPNTHTKTCQAKDLSCWMRGLYPKVLSSLTSMPLRNKTTQKQDRLIFLQTYFQTQQKRCMCVMHIAGIHAELALHHSISHGIFPYKHTCFYDK